MITVNQRTALLLAKLVREFGRIQTMSLEQAERLDEFLRKAPDEALREIVGQRIKWCWFKAQRILRERGR